MSDRTLHKVRELHHVIQSHGCRAIPNDRNMGDMPMRTSGCATAAPRISCHAMGMPSGILPRKTRPRPEKSARRSATSAARGVANHGMIPALTCIHELVRDSSTQSGRIGSQSSRSRTYRRLDSLLLTLLDTSHLLTTLALDKPPSCNIS